MKSALELVKELNEASKEYPTVVPIVGAILELEEKFAVWSKRSRTNRRSKKRPFRIRKSPAEI